MSSPPFNPLDPDLDPELNPPGDGWRTPIADLDSFGPELAYRHLPEMQRLANSRMLDEFDFFDHTGKYIYDPEAQEEVPEYEFMFHTIGRIRVTDTQALQHEGGGREIIVAVRFLHIPFDSPETPSGAIAVPTRLDSSTDQTVKGPLRVVGSIPGSQRTARRLQVEEVQT